MPSVAETLSDFAAALRFEELNDAVLHEAKRRIVDSLGCALAAFHQKPVAIARALALRHFRGTDSTLLGTSEKSSPDIAAFVNGSMIRFFDYNDTYLSLEPAHPSDNLSAALAVAECEGKGGKELLTALVLGYEVQCRLCDAASLRWRGWDHVTYGPLSTALVTAKIMGLTRAEMVHALGLAGVPNVALRQTRVGELSMWKGCAFANAARNGVFAALLARGGMTGPAPLFEGERGFFNLVSGRFPPPSMAADGHFKILDTYIKFYPAEYHAQTAIEAALELRPRIPSVDAIVKIDIESFDACVDIIAGEPEKWKPATRETADHSLPYCVAVALADASVTLESFAPERLSDERLLGLMQKIRVARNAELSSRYPGEMPNDIRIELRNGEVLRAVSSHPRGHPLNPMTDSEVEAKFRRLVSPVLPAGAIDQALAEIWNLEKASTLAPLFSACSLGMKR